MAGGRVNAKVGDFVKVQRDAHPGRRIPAPFYGRVVVSPAPGYYHVHVERSGKPAGSRGVNADEIVAILPRPPLSLPRLLRWLDE